MDYLNNISTLYERDLIITEIEAYKRKDLDSIRKSFLDQIQDLDIDDLYKKLKKVEIVKIVLAIEPTVGILNKIRDFFDTNYDQKVIFDYETDKSMLGGIKIIYKGKYFDYSVWTQVHKF